ncbi:MAG TPA: hypothetical protein VJ853_13435 [Thermoanaerobaculia bacterium]|nr:hypothetical protein [Thermoanaerobaculia bacterium]
MAFSVDELQVLRILRGKAVQLLARFEDIRIDRVAIGHAERRFESRRSAERDGENEREMRPFQNGAAMTPMSAAVCDESRNIRD